MGCMAIDPGIANLASQFGVCEYVIGKALEDLTEEEAWRHPDDVNPMIWLLGHVTHYRTTLLSRLGDDVEAPWAEQFARGCDPKSLESGPSFKEVLDAWEKSKEALKARFETLTDEELSAAAPGRVPMEDKSMRGMIAFMAFHESYHAGQIAYLAKWLGKWSVVG